MTLVSALQAPAGVADAIRKASDATGADFDYLLQTAARESSFNETAHAGTSSAAGLFQFIDKTWLQTIKQDGPGLGLGKYADAIRQGRGGHYYVPDPGKRSEILNLRYDPEVSAAVAGAFTQNNEQALQAKIGRPPTQGELYIAHFLGADSGSRLIQLASARPDTRADVHFPRAARANRAIFYAHGRPRSLKAVYDRLAGKQVEVKVSAPKPVAATQAPPAQAPQPLFPDRNGGVPFVDQAASDAVPRKVAGYVSRIGDDGANREGQPLVDFSRRPLIPATQGNGVPASTIVGGATPHDPQNIPYTGIARIASASLPQVPTVLTDAGGGLGQLGLWTASVHDAYGTTKEAVGQKQDPFAEAKPAPTRHHRRRHHARHVAQADTAPKRSFSEKIFSALGGGT